MTLNHLERPSTVAVSLMFTMYVTFTATFCLNVNEMNMQKTGPLRLIAYDITSLIYNIY